jgi:hypothetical protein
MLYEQFKKLVLLNYEKFCILLNIMPESLADTDVKFWTLYFEGFPFGPNLLYVGFQRCLITAIACSNPLKSWKVIFYVVYVSKWV